MFTSVSSRLAQGCRRSVIAPSARVTVPFAGRRYCVEKDLEAEIKEDLKIVREEYAKHPKPLPVRERLEAVSNSAIADYTPLYNHFATSSPRSDYPAAYYDAPAGAQEAFRAFEESNIKAFEELLEKHGENLGPGQRRLAALMKFHEQEPGKPLRVCITGAAGALGYALVFRIASGSVFGHNTPIILSLLEVPQALDSLKGVVMELRDCAFPVLKDIIATDDAEKAFEQIDYGLLVGASPRKDGMERGDLLMANAQIFSAQGKALNKMAKGNDTRILVVGNPANTNALIASHYATNIPKTNFSAMTRLDHNRGLAQLAQKLKCTINDIDRFVIWGNHSATQYPDITHAKIKGKYAVDVVTDKTWLEKEFYPTVQKRGAAIIKARGKSSAASAASAAADAVADWHFGTNGTWTSAAVVSKGEYGITEGLFYSYPVVYNSSQEWDIVRDLPITEASAQYMEATHQELLAEKAEASSFLN